jgi:hypothetical protein
MNCYMIAYDLKDATEDDYNNLHAAIEKYKNHKHVLYSFWVIQTERSLRNIHAYLKPFIKPSGWLIVNRFPNGASFDLPKDISNWLNAHQEKS